MKVVTHVDQKIFHWEARFGTLLDLQAVLILVSEKDIRHISGCVMTPIFLFDPDSTWINARLNHICLDHCSSLFGDLIGGYVYPSILRACQNCCDQT